MTQHGGKVRTWRWAVGCFLTRLNDASEVVRDEKRVCMFRSEERISDMW